MLKKYIVGMIGSLCLGLSFSHAIIVQVPSQQVQPDVVVTGPTQIKSDEGSIFEIIQLVNKYLWFAVSVVSMGVLVFGGFKLMTAQGDEKKMQEANKLLIGALIGIVIALLSYAIVRLLINVLS